MKKYVFRLETVRRVRRTQEDLAAADLLRANTEVQRAIAVVEERLEDYETATTVALFGSTGGSTGGATTGGSPGVDEFMKNRYLNELSGKAVIAARSSQRAAEIEAGAKREMWSQAAMKVKVLDRLDGRRRQEHAVAAQRAEDREVDDIVTGRFKSRPFNRGSRVVNR